MLAAGNAARNTPCGVLANVEHVRVLPFRNKCLQIGAGAKGAALSRQDGNINRVVFGEVRPNVGQFVVELVIKGVERGGTVQGDVGDPIALLEIVTRASAAAEVFQTPSAAGPGGGAPRSERNFCGRQHAAAKRTRSRLFSGISAVHARASRKMAAAEGLGGNAML